ncbi:MAG: peptidylprolyl isomerase [Patescibacteria group bacterium]|jgi:cyclophilin family peptidyl-prolyl cis-trans isomerase
MKTLIVIIAALILTGCSAKKNMIIDEKNAPGNSYASGNGDDIGRINAIKNGLTPKVKPTGKKTDTAGGGEETGGQNDGKQQTQMEDLVSQYGKATIKTNFGDIKVEFYKTDSPITVNVFMNLAKTGFYEGIKFHRVIKDFMIQGGDPLSKDDDPSNDGQGGPGFKFQDEFNNHKLVKGSLAMANSGPNTNGSQFFLVTADETPWLDGKHTNFGQVIEGMEVMEKIGKLATDATDHPLEEVIINKVELE